MLPPELQQSTYSDYIEETADGLYFRYDTEDSTPQENYDVYIIIQEDLQVSGYMLDESYIEHDCITGYLIPWVSP